MSGDEKLRRMRNRMSCVWIKRLLIYFFFFFSSRRRHTRFDCDWSSDVCSSDLFVSLREYEYSSEKRERRSRLTPSSISPERAGLRFVFPSTYFFGFPPTI